MNCFDSDISIDSRLEWIDEFLIRSHDSNALTAFDC